MNKNAQDFKLINIIEISVEEGFNPRKHFDNNEFQDLVRSVESQGVVSPITIRPIPESNDGYYVVAGERRFRAAVAAGLSKIPAVVVALSDREARLIATIENTQRENMSIAEEAESARRVLTDCGNDKQEALRLLGWSPLKFDSRMLLLHAAPEVLGALTERKIKIGHAELLSQLPVDFQTATLSKIIEHGYTIIELKTKLAQFSLDLSKACFNTSGCNGCPHNSTLQASLFEDNIGEGNCANRECYEEKSIAAMVDKKSELSEQYTVIYLDTERSPNSYKVICQSGPEGVGKKQFDEGCKQCAHFGALLESSPDRRGQVTDDCCFDLECHKSKVLSYQESMKKPVSKEDDGTKKSKTGRVEKEGSGKTSNVSDEKKQEGSGGEAVSSSAAIPNRVIEKIESFYRELAAKTVTKDRRSILILNTFSLFKLIRSSWKDELWPESLAKKPSITIDFDQFIELISAMETEDVSAFNNKMLSHLLSEHEKNTLVKSWSKGAGKAIKNIGVNISEHFVLNEEFLGSFTKAGIGAVLHECQNGKGESFVSYYESKGEGQKVSTLLGKKNKEILGEVFSCGFDFSGFVPSCVSRFIGDDGNELLGKEVESKVVNEVIGDKAESVVIDKDVNESISGLDQEEQDSDEDDEVLETILRPRFIPEESDEFDDIDEFPDENLDNEYTEEPEEPEEQDYV